MNNGRYMICKKEEETTGRVEFMLLTPGTYPRARVGVDPENVDAALKCVSAEQCFRACNSL